jgi:hypothetical protein
MFPYTNYNQLHNPLLSATPNAMVPANQQPHPEFNQYFAQMQVLQAQISAMQQQMASMQLAYQMPVLNNAEKLMTAKDPNAPKRPIPEGTMAWINYVHLIRNEITERIRSTDPDYKGLSWKAALQEAKRMKDAGDPRYQYKTKSRNSSLSSSQQQSANPSPLFLPFPAVVSNRAPVEAEASASALTETFAPTPTHTSASVPKRLVRKSTVASSKPVALSNTAASSSKAVAPSKTVAPSKAVTRSKAVAPSKAVAQKKTATQYMDIENDDETDDEVKTSNDESEETVLQEVTINGITYLMSTNNECWIMDSDGSMGAWAGVYNGKSIDDSIPEPNF